MEDTAPTPHLRSEYPYPNGFLRVLLLTIHLLLCEPRGFANGFGEWLGNSRLIWLLSVVPSSLELTFCPADLVFQLCRLFAVELVQAGEVDG